jgi:preprotein translocase subunit SecF
MGFVIYNVNRYTPRQMVVLPMVLLIISLAILGYNMASTGMPVKPGMDFSGGTAVTLLNPENPDSIRTTFSGYPVMEPIGEKFIKFGPMDEATSESLARLISDRYPDANIDQIGPAFGQTLQQQAALALVFSFIGMAIVVFLAFRNFVPAGAVVLSAFADIAMTAAVMSVIGIELTLPTTAALLMLIGYSVDSDILLTMRVLKRQGKLDEKLAGAFTTGIIMTTTTLAAIAAMWVVAFAGEITVIRDISSVLLIGLVVDMMNTWFTNAGIIKWFVQKQESRQVQKQEPRPRKETGKKRGAR